MLQSKKKTQCGSALPLSSKELLDKLPIDLKGALHLRCSQEAETGQAGAVLLTARVCFSTWLCSQWRINGIKCFFSGTEMQEYEKVPHLKHGAGEWGTSDHLPSSSLD